jgi:hypothetical protein
MGDVGRTVNHTFRRKAARLLKIEPSNNVALSKAMSGRFVISFISVQLGRAELEEYLILRWRATLMNKVSKRLRSGRHYEWVRAANNALERERGRQLRKR